MRKPKLNQKLSSNHSMWLKFLSSAQRFIEEAEDKCFQMSVISPKYSKKMTSYKMEVFKMSNLSKLAWILSLINPFFWG